MCKCSDDIHRVTPNHPRCVSQLPLISAPLIPPSWKNFSLFPPQYSHEGVLFSWIQTQTLGEAEVNQLALPPREYREQKEQILDPSSLWDSDAWSEEVSSGCAFQSLGRAQLRKSAMESGKQESRRMWTRWEICLITNIQTSCLHIADICPYFVRRANKCTCFFLFCFASAGFCTSLATRWLINEVLLVNSNAHGLRWGHEFEPYLWTPSRRVWMMVTRRSHKGDLWVRDPHQVNSMTAASPSGACSFFVPQLILHGPSVSLCFQLHQHAM